MQQPANVSEIANPSEIANQLQTQFETIRKSEYFPAILGAVAGAAAAGIIAAIISRRGRTVERVIVQEGDSEETYVPEQRQTELITPKSRETLILGFTLGEIAQLVSIIATLARQIREWSAEQSQYK